MVYVLLLAHTLVVVHVLLSIAGITQRASTSSVEKLIRVNSYPLTVTLTVALTLTPLIVTATGLFTYRRDFYFLCFRNNIP